MARLVFFTLAVFVAVVMMSSETVGLPVGESLPTQQGFIGLFENQRQCKNIGEKCMVHEECCSQRCLFYAAKCVT